MLGFVVGRESVLGFVVGRESVLGFGFTVGRESVLGFTGQVSLGRETVGLGAIGRGEALTDAFKLGYSFECVSK